MTTCIATLLVPAPTTGELKLARAARTARADAGGASSRARPRRAAALAVAVLSTVVAGCRDAPTHTDARAPSSSAAPPATAPRARPRPAPGSSPLRADPWWAAALASDDPLASAALAAHVGPAALAGALGDEDAVRAVALRALPHADRPDLALGALADALGAARGDEAVVADTIEGAIVAVRRDVEPIDPEGARRCADVLDRVADEGGRGGLGAARARALARRLRTRGS
jgi:hypothetical protein